MAIDVEVGHVAVHALAHVICQPAHGQHVRRPIECQPVVEVEPLAGHHFGGYWLKPRVVAAERVGLSWNLPTQPSSVHDTEIR